MFALFVLLPERFDNSPSDWVDTLLIEGLDALVRIFL